MSLVYGSNGHLTKEVLKLLKQDELQIQDKIDALEHIGKCDECASIFSGLFNDADLVKEPAEFIQTTIIKLDGAVVQKKYGRDKRVLREYTFRVGLAACFSLALFFSGVFNFTADLGKSGIPTLDLTVMNTITHDVRNFSDKIMKMEVIKDDTKKK